MRLGVLAPYLKSLLNVPDKLRLGTEYGGWTIPKNLLTKHSVCYCVGCGEDISFDLALADKYSCEVFGFDPTPRSIAYVERVASGIRNYHFQDVGIWEREGVVRFFAPQNSKHVSHSITNLQHSSDYIEIRTVRLKQVLEKNGHKNLSVLKLDIEGAENVVIGTIVEDKLSIDVLCVEFDELWFPTPERIMNSKASIDRLFGFGYKIFWVEGSNFTFVR
jgi:FkbM family methyltransferase